MASANVTTGGQALGLQKGSHTSRSQWAHQVTAAALSIGFLTGHMWNIVPSHKTMRNSTARSGANIWHQNTMLHRGNTLASHLCGRGSIPVMAVSGKAGSCLPLVGSLQYRTLANYMYWFPLPFQLPVVI